VRAGILLSLFFVTLLSAQNASAQWSPDRDYSRARQKCAAARTASDVDECRDLAERLVSGLDDCVRAGGPSSARCAALQRRAQAMLDTANRKREGQANRGSAGAKPDPNARRKCVPMQNYWYCY
jgi:hypothetical protein